MEDSRNENGDSAQQSSSSSAQPAHQRERMIPVGFSSSDGHDDGRENNDIETDGGANQTNGQVKTTTTKKKTKARYSKAKKRELKFKRQQEKDINTSSNQSNKESRKNAKKPKERRRPEATRLALKCAQESLFTQSVIIMSTSEGNKTKNQRRISNEILEPFQRNDSSPSVRIVTSCDLGQHQHDQHDSNDNDGDDPNGRSMMLTSSQIRDHNTTFRFPTDTATVVRVQPLLVLDLNGVLCHRVRTHKQPPGSIPYLREPVGFVAQTNVIGRPAGGTEEFLRYLDKHFCLAIWTSARRKTMNALLDLFVPDDIRGRFLFVWGQNYCTAVKSQSSSKLQDKELGVDDNQIEDDRDDDVLFEKRLPNVWKAFPLWSANNTLLMDDSPEKCRHGVSNAIHPIPLHGQQQKYCCLDKDSSGVTTVNKVNNIDRDVIYVPPNLSDEENCQNQELFFQRLVTFFNRNPVSMDIKKKNEQSTITNISLRSFLAAHAEPTFVWRDDE